MFVKNIAIFVVNFYILINILFGQNGFFAIYKINEKINNAKIEYQNLVQENYVRRIKCDMLNEDRIDLRYLEELLRTQYSFAEKKEKVIFLN